MQTRKNQINWEQEYLNLSRQERKAKEYMMATTRTKMALYAAIVSSMSVVISSLLLVGRIIGWF